MKSLSSVGLGLSIVFGVLFLALMAELYYLLWWKKSLTNDYNNNNPASELFYMFCWKKSALNPHEIQQQQSQVHHLQPNKELFFKPHDVDVVVDDGDDDDDDDSDGLGAPRLLFTIVEETKEDLESEEAKSKKGRSLSDVVFNVETPYLTPLASPPFLTPPLTPLEAACYNRHGSFNPLFESSNGGDLEMPLPSSPPPKFKVLATS